LEANTLIYIIETLIAIFGISSIGIFVYKKCNKKIHINKTNQTIIGKGDNISGNKIVNNLNNENN